MSAFGKQTIESIFGNKKYLRFDEDHEKLLICLELSDIEGCDNKDDDSENENGNADGIREENVEEQSDINAENFNEEDIEEDLEIQSDFESDESDPEMNIPLSTLKDQWCRKVGKKLTDSSLAFLEDWKVLDYFKMYFDNSDVENMCACIDLKYRIEHKAMNLSLEKIRKFLGISILMSCLEFPQIKMYWASLTRVSKISNSMTRKRFFSIRSHLKVVVDSDVSEEIRKKDELWKIKPLADKIRNSCLSLERRHIVAVDEQMSPFTGVCTVEQFVRGKPNPEGLKNFVCATPEGLILDFEIY
ncbi:hypothetical protein JTB14_011281 [Gonioctena quinquepunctata]|nr:hypothetical protein JTB14_011281 [Gonioctena quinquepunctata]